jgi:hypothetical protein
MTDTPRERLIIPTAEELTIAFASMRGRTQRAAQRGEKAKKQGDIGYANANRLLAANTHIDEHLQMIARGIGRGATASELDGMGVSASDIFMLGAKHMLEIMTVATTYDELPDFDSLES